MEMILESPTIDPMVIMVLIPKNLKLRKISINVLKSIQDADASKLQVHNIVSSNKVISKVSFPRGLDKTSTKIIVNLQLFEQALN